ncbi:MAG TPA: OsmC family protein [Longimicrobiales bacterium]
MADSQVSLHWNGAGLQFEAAHPSGNAVHLDGNGKAAYSPVQALLLSLASCTAADVVDIAGKMRVALSGLDVFVEGNRNPEAPRYFQTVHIRYLVRGVAESDRSKIERAIGLSHDKYCSVLHSLRRDLEFSSELELV